ncbi:MAG: substrate-binding domain-containing protein, partial [Muribaculaceae bacterium]|nr:substrate-binding domain-containing protein [Muribaculaceae bacterium]
ECSDDAWRQQMNDEINREILFHEEADVEIRNAGDDSQRQIEDIEYFLKEGFDIIIIAPNEAEKLTPVVREAYRKGVPVIIFDRNINDTTYTARIDLDNVSIGREAGKYALHTLEKTGGKIVELTGLPGSTPAEERHTGFMTAIADSASENFAGSYAADWNSTPAYHLTDSLLVSNPDIKIIYAHNDVMALAASKAARERNRHDVVVIGTDGAPKLGIKAVSDSLIDITFTYPTVGEEVIKLAMDILTEKDYEKDNKMEAVSFINRDNAGMHLKLNELLRQKVNRIEDLNSRYTLINSRHNTQRALLYVTVVAVILLSVGLAVLLHFIRQRAKLNLELSEKNSQLLEREEKQRELYDQLQEATRSKLAFYTNVSHDLRTPLALIAEPVQKIESRDYLPESDRMLMKLVVKNVKILKRMIDQILDFRRYENGAINMKLHEVNIIALISDWAASFRDYAISHNIDFSFSCTEDPDKRNEENEGCKNEFMMAVDVEKMERIFFNLLSNAFKYTEANGKVGVSLSFSESALVIKISDTGIGIPAEELSKIFDRFYQVDRPRPKGSGIGLSLTKAFVELMNGTISVESTPGRGSLFTVIIPVTHTDNETNESEKTELSSHSFDIDIIDTIKEDEVRKIRESENNTMAHLDPANKPLLLVIDDNEDIRMLVGMMVSDSYTVIMASNGKEGLRLALKYIPDIIVCDIMMPDIDGLEVTRRLKGERLTSHIPVLILTACRLDEQRVKSYDSGADGFLSKPFTETMLKARLDSLIKNRRRIYDLLLENGSDSAKMTRRDEPIRGNTLLELDNAFYRDFIAQVKASYSNEDLTVVELAERLGIGATQLTRKIKALTGTTPVEIIRTLRLQEARRRLLVTDDTVAEIAFATGFSSPQYFARCFRDAYGMSPTELRNSVR